MLGYFLVAFSAYWLWRSLEFSVGLLIGLARLHRPERRDWLAVGEDLPGFERMHHLVIVPTYRESDEILAETLHCLVARRLPLERIAVVLAFEERDPDAAGTRRAPERSASRAAFGHLLVTLHPDLPGEVKGKSSNLAWAARRVEDELIATGPARRAQLAGHRVRRRFAPDRQYLAALGYEVLSHPDGRLHIYQPADPVLCQPRRLLAAAARGEQRLLAVLAGADGGQPSPGHRSRRTR